MNDHNNNAAGRTVNLFAEVLTIVTTDVLDQRIQMAAEWRRLYESRREAKALVQAVDAWLAGGAA